MQIKKTRILHKRYTSGEWLNQTLRQGEIGFLLSDDKLSVLQVRVGTQDILLPDGSIIGVSFNNAMLLSSIGGSPPGTTPPVDNEQFQLLIDDLNNLVERVEDNEESIKSFTDTNTHYQIVPGVEDNGTIKIQSFTKDDIFINSYEVKIPGWDDLVSIALGRTSSYVYQNKNDFNYITDINTKDKYKVGDIIYFKDLGATDLWVTKVLSEPVNNSYYEFSTLKVESPKLEDYLSKSEAGNIYVSKERLNLISLETLGGEGQYIQSITLANGQISVEVNDLPDFLKIALKEDEAVLKSAYTYTDTLIGELGTAEDGSTHTVKSYVDTKIGNNQLSAIENRIGIVESNLTNLNNKIINNSQVISNILTSVKSINDSLNTNISALTKRIEIIESNSGGSGGTPVVTGIRGIQLGGKTLPVSNDNMVNINEISTDLLVQGINQLIFDCNKGV